MNRIFWIPLLICFCLMCGGISRAAEPTEELPERVSFNTHIRPILSNVCFQCHGPDEKNRDGDLRLDTREGATADRGDYAAIVPGRPEASALLERVTAADEDIVMPPPDSKKERLTARQIALLKKWIEQGAEYEGHWAFLPLADVAPPVPANNKDEFSRNPLDAFVLEKLSAARLKPSAEADRATFLRRMALDLTGLLPSPEFVAEFLADNSPDAVERLADRLLADPHYGERWGRHWLDQARYADSHGYSIDGERSQWPYRDWVIRALQQDMPFDQFTVEQLAGDLLPQPTKSQLIATAFHRNTLINQEGGTDAEQFRNEAVVDRVSTTGAVWLGLTVGCAQCHTHKYDPITHEDFYRLFAFFNQGDDINNKGSTTSVLRGEVFGRPATLPTDDTEQQLAARQQQWEAGQRALLQPAAGAPSTGESQSSRNAAAEWTAAKYDEYESTSNAGLQMLEDNSLLADGRGDANDTYRMLLSTKLPEVAALRLRVLPHESLPKMGPGLASNGNFVLTRVEINVDGKPVSLAGAFADHEQPGYPISAVLDNQGTTGWAINVGAGQKAQMNAPHEAVFILEKPLAATGKQIEVLLKHEMNERYLIGRFALDVSAKRPPLPKSAQAKDQLQVALKLAPEKRSAEQVKLVREAFLKSDPQAKQLSDTKAARQKKLDGSKAEVMIMRDRTPPRQTFILTRGDFLRPDQKVGPLQPGVIAAVQRGFRTPIEQFEFKNRIDLAKWLVHPENPLTPRVTINRMWLRYFGRGLVETEEDFGTQGSPPTHPELLDWLGGEFIRQGWSQQAMHRLIVTSATYRQSSKMRSDLTQADPLNKLLGRQARIRVEGEIVRDAALSAAGMLTRNIGGPSVHPPQPEGVYAFTQNAKSWKSPQDEDRFRRGLYTFFYRSAPYPLLTTFDAPDFQLVCTKRARSNTPLQSLTLANDIAFVEIAQGLALRMQLESPAHDDIDARLTHGFLLCLQRKPSLRELGALRDFYNSQLASFDDAPSEATLLVSPTLKSASRSLPEAAAWVCVARVLLNTDAFITRE